ncbi:rpoC2 [Acrasis kona]|uniref:RpoC2 n=1 Tax=Acrasis kona TaxID=1008807 RepID=A0AAW2Z8Y4_9EUKA
MQENNPYTLPDAKFITHNNIDVPLEEYFDKHSSQIYNMLPFSQDPTFSKKYTTQEKINMTDSILNLSKGTGSDNMFLCGMDMATTGNKLITQAQQRVCWDALQNKKDHLTEQEYTVLLKNIEQANMDGCRQILENINNTH